jgi:hypothetical protein
MRRTFPTAGPEPQGSGRADSKSIPVSRAIICATGPSGAGALLAADVIDRVPKLGSIAAYTKQGIREKLIEHQD